MSTFSIIRFIRGRPAVTLRTGCSLEEATRWINDKETSALTCSQHTRETMLPLYGPAWFDSYGKE